MKYGSAVSEKFPEHAIKDVLNSLEGPIVKRASTSEVEITFKMALTSEVEITSVVDYYGVLPYAEIISNWVSRTCRTCSPCSEPNSAPIIDDHAMRDDLLNDQVEDTLMVETGKLTTDKSVVKQIETLGDASSPKIFDSDHLLVPASMPAIDYLRTTEMSGSNEQLPINNNKILETEKPNFTKNNDISLMNVPPCGVSRSLEVADIMHTEERAKNDESFPSAQTTNVDDSFMNGLSVNSREDDNPSFNHHQILTQTEDISGKSDPDSYITRGNNHIPTELYFPFDGSGNKAGTVDLPKEACVVKRKDQSRTDVSNDIPDGIASDDVHLAPIQSCINDLDTFYHGMKSRENDLMKACLRVLQKKKDELYQHQRVLEDEIARCEMNIQTIMTEGDESTLKVESILEALNSLSSGVQVGKNVVSQEQGTFQTTKRRKLSEALLSSKDACQELHEVCDMNSWILPRYCVLPSFADCQINGKFEARVTVVGMDFECSSCGDPKSDPQQARESAATLMLQKLRSEAVNTNCSS